MPKAGVQTVTAQSRCARASGSPWGCSPPSSLPLCGSVMTQALGIGHRHQKQIESAGLMAQLIDIALTGQALIYPAALLGHFAELGKRDRTFVHPDGLRGQRVSH
jgi:hypothetical protein